VRVDRLLTLPEGGESMKAYPKPKAKKTTKKKR
jgi:hypothetical protein